MINLEKKMGPLSLLQKFATSFGREKVLSHVSKITAGCMLKIGPICWVGKLLITLVKLLLASVSVLFAHDSRLRYIIILSEQSQVQWGQTYSGGSF